MSLYRQWLSWLPLFFPLYLVRWEVGGVPSTLLEGVMGVTALWGLFFVRPRSAWVWFKREIHAWKTRPTVWVILFVVAATISMLRVPPTMLTVDGEMAMTARVAQGIWKGWIVMPAFYFFMLQAIPKPVLWWQRTWVALGLSGIVLSGLAVYQMITGDYLTTDGRASGPFESANYLALYLGPVLLGAVIHALESLTVRKWKSGTLCGLATLFMAVAFWGTQSYAAFIAFGAGLGVYALLHPRILSRHKLIFIGVAGLVAIGLFLSQLNTEKFQEFLDFENRTSSSVRVEVYTIAITLIREHPIAGIGLGQFELLYAVRAPEILGHVPYEWVMLHPHNLLLAFWLNTGLLGVLSMGVVVAVMVRNVWRQRRATVFTLYRLMAMSMLALILVHGLFDSPFWKNDLSYLWWLVLAMGL